MASMVAILDIGTEPVHQVTPMPPTKFRLNREQTWSEDFQDGHHGGHLGYQNGMILAILNLYVALMPPIKFQLTPTYSLEGDVI